MLLEDELKYELKKQGVDFVHFVDVSHLKSEQNRNFPRAVLFGIVLTPEYLQKVTDSNDYVQNMIRHNLTSKDEFHLTEIKTDKIADYLADFIVSKGYSACSQSENNLLSTGFYKLETKTTTLPHKTIAGMAGLGWIGKNNLLVTAEYGCAISMCSVLTDGPLKTVLFSHSKSQCGECSICSDICAVNALKGKEWKPGVTREEIVDVFKCNTCLKCMVLCPWTQSYMKKNNFKAE